MAWTVCSLCVWGCAETQRDFYQAPPPQPARWALATTGRQDFSSLVVTALSREGYDFASLDSVPTLLHGEIRREGRGDGQIIAVEYEPESPSRLAVEVRLGLIGNPALEQRLAQAIVDQLATPSGGPEAAADSGAGWSAAALSGRWIDLESAVTQAGVTEKRRDDLAVVSVDRWRYATFFELRTLNAREARLIVIGDRTSASGPRAVYVRIGLFGNPAEEKAFLKRLRACLAELGREQRLPGAF